MILPVSHEETEVRRDPWVTFGFMAACTAVMILVDRYGDAEIYERWGLIPKYPSIAGLMTYMFLHGGWGHLIGNLLILFLAGPPLEDRWGRAFFAGIFVVSGVVAGGFYTLMSPGSSVPLVGASGAIAALMGASLVRFWSTKIRFIYFFWLLRPIRGDFWAPVWVILPLWFLDNLAMTQLVDHSGLAGGVAYWCHVGGFAFGVAVAFGMRHWQIEGRYINPAIEARITLAHNPVIDEAMELRINGHSEAAYELLSRAAGKHSGDPDVVSAFWELACELRRSDDAVSLMFGLVRRSLARGEDELAVQYWEEIAERAPAARADRALLLLVIPVLVDQEKCERAVQALRRALDPQLGKLSAGVACHLLDLAQDVDPPTALFAARSALAAAGLHPAKRERVEALAAALEERCASLPVVDSSGFSDSSIPLEDDPADAFTPPSNSETPPAESRARELDATGSLVASDSSAELMPDLLAPEQWAGTASLASPGGPAQDPVAHALASEASATAARFHGLKVIEAVPLELLDDGVRLRRVGGAAGQVDYRAIQALAVGAVRELASKPVLLVDLIANWTDSGEGPLQLIRLRSDGFDVRKLNPHVTNPLDAFRTFLEQLLARTGALPLPDRDAVRGRPFPGYSDLESYQREVLQAEA